MSLFEIILLHFCAITFFRFWIPIITKARSISLGACLAIALWSAPFSITIHYILQKYLW